MQMTSLCQDHHLPIRRVTIVFRELQCLLLLGLKSLTSGDPRDTHGRHGHDPPAGFNDRATPGAQGLELLLDLVGRVVVALKVIIIALVDAFSHERDGVDLA